jgi:ferritin
LRYGLDRRRSYNYTQRKIIEGVEMELSDRMRSALNDQINLELASAYVYLSMSAYCLDIGMKGFAGWMLKQSEEEVGHAMRIFHYLDERSARIQLKPVEGPQVEWKSPLEVFRDSLAHEQKVTASIHRIVDMAIDERDHATARFLDWFVDEQVEEESSVGDVIDKLELVGDQKQALYLLDRELGARENED